MRKYYINRWQATNKPLNTVREMTVGSSMRKPTGSGWRVRSVVGTRIIWRTGRAFSRVVVRGTRTWTSGTVYSFTARGIRTGWDCTSTIRGRGLGRWAVRVWILLFCLTRSIRGVRHYVMPRRLKQPPWRLLQPSIKQKFIYFKLDNRNH